MEIVNMSKKKYEELTSLEIDPSIINTEAKLLIAKLRNKDKVFKNLYRLNGPVFGNKLYTLELLDTFKEILPHSFVMPDSLCSVQGQIKGFSMDIIDGKPLSVILDDKKIDNEIHIHYLKEVGKLLEQLSKIRQNTELDSIFINDLHSANFVVERGTGTLRTVDIDSVKIGDNRPFPSKYLSSRGLLENIVGKYNIYNKGAYTEEESKKYDYRAPFGYIDPDANSDAYCYVIMILNYLYGGNVCNMNLEEYYNYLYYLERIGIDHNLMESFYRIVSNYDNDIPIDTLDTLTGEQIGRSKQAVYKLVKGK
jgi:hypothetical protein